ncbi:MAG: hypothetical protein ACE5LC_01385 [Candidatus Aminicenantales bacterium]
MKRNPLQTAIEGGIRFLSELFPLKDYLYFPLLNAALIWAVRRREDWKEKIFSWQVWLEPDFVSQKPDKFILDFFKKKKTLATAYEREIEEKDLSGLRKAFNFLYPVFGLEDPFLLALFHEEVERENFREIVEDFIPRLTRARDDIRAAGDEAGLLKRLKSFSEEMLSLGVDLLTQAEIQKMIASALKRSGEKKDG